jgi:hypothetical protein
MGVRSNTRRENENHTAQKDGIAMETPLGAPQGECEPDKTKGLIAKRDCEKTE